MTRKRIPRKKRTGIRAALLTGLVLAGLLSPALAAKKKPAQDTPAIVSGSVFDDRGYALADANVTLAPEDEAGAVKGKEKPREAVSDARGEFVFHVPAGPARYTVSVAARGHRSQQKSIMLEDQERVEVTFQLEPLSK